MDLAAALRHPLRTALTAAVAVAAFGVLAGALGMVLSLIGLIVLGGLMILAAVVVGAAVLAESMARIRSTPISTDRSAPVWHH